MSHTPKSAVEVEEAWKKHYAEFGELILEHWVTEKGSACCVLKTVIFTGTRKDSLEVKDRYDTALKNGAILAPLVYSLDDTYRWNFDFCVKS